MLYLTETDARQPLPPLNTDSTKQQIFGMLPRPKISYEELCPPIQCSECDTKETIKCTLGGVSFIDLISRWEVRPFQENITYPGYPPRSKGEFLKNIWSEMKQEQGKSFRPSIERLYSYIWKCCRLDLLMCRSGIRFHSSRISLALPIFSLSQQLVLPNFDRMKQFWHLCRSMRQTVYCWTLLVSVGLIIVAL